MMHVLNELILFGSKTLILFIFFAAIIILIFSLTGRNKKIPGTLSIKNLNKKLQETTDFLLTETLSKKELKQYYKQKKKENKIKARASHQKNVYVLNFHGDIKASAVDTLREEINSLLQIVTKNDEILVRLESAGGMVHAYGLAAAELMRIRAKRIPLIIAIDKVAASGGYLMAAIADKIIAAPFSIIGSIGVVVQLPNFHRFLQNKKIDFEQHTAGEFKRTISVFGENTKEGREKLQEEIDKIHQLFKNVIVDYRPKVNIDEVSTGEYWLGKQAIDMKLIDEIKTSDEYLMEKIKTANTYEICYQVKKPFMNRFSAGATKLFENLFRLSSYLK